MHRPRVSTASRFALVSLLAPVLAAGCSSPGAGVGSDAAGVDAPGSDAGGGPIDTGPWPDAGPSRCPGVLLDPSGTAPVLSGNGPVLAAWLDRPTHRVRYRMLDIPPSEGPAIVVDDAIDDQGPPSAASTASQSVIAFAAGGQVYVVVLALPTGGIGEVMAGHGSAPSVAVDYAGEPMVAYESATTTGAVDLAFMPYAVPFTGELHHTTLAPPAGHRYAHPRMVPSGSDYALFVDDVDGSGAATLVRAVFHDDYTTLMMTTAPVPLASAAGAAHVTVSGRGAGSYALVYERGGSVEVSISETLTIQVDGTTGAHDPHISFGTGAEFGVASIRDAVLLSIPRADASNTFQPPLTVDLSAGAIATSTPQYSHGLFLVAYETPTGVYARVACP